MSTVMEATGLSKYFPIRRGLMRREVARVRAVEHASFTIDAGRTLGLVGESGSGKSTLARLVTGLIKPTSGTLQIAGQDANDWRGRRGRQLRRNVQMVFQDPYSSLDPMSTVGASIVEPLRSHRATSSFDERRLRVEQLLKMVGLRPEHRHSYPSEMSGGQLQRVAVARALALSPQILVLDEPVSALDVSTQAEVINLLSDLQQQQRISLLLIAHDLAVVRHVSHNIAVMYLGQIVESGPAEEVYTSPKHPYTVTLLQAIPVPDPAKQRARRRIGVRADIPSPTNPPSGCRFHTRCPFVMDVCRTESPDPYLTPVGTVVRCHLHERGIELRGRSVFEAVD